MKTLGENVVSLLSAARENALIVAPFIRSDALGRVLENVRDDTPITIVTRWRPSDILAGASDLRVYDMAEARKAQLYLRYDLHAKFFAGDNKCLVGSANVTLSALGWRNPSNFELLIPIARNADHIVEFEKELLAGSVRAREEQKNRLEELFERLRDLAVAVPKDKNEEKAVGLLPPSWIPRIRNPEELYTVYRGESDVSRSALRPMQETLAQIGAVSGLDEEGFRAWVAASISQTPLIAKVIQHIDSKGQVTESALGEVLVEIGVTSEEFRPREVLEMLERWMTYFLPARYETARDSIKLIKAKEV